MIQNEIRVNLLRVDDRIVGEGSSLMLSAEVIDLTSTPLINAKSIGVGTSAPVSLVQLAASSAPTIYNLANEYLHIGEGTITPNAIRAIGFGYTGNTNTYSPAYLGYVESNPNGQTNGNFIIALRAGTSDSSPDPRFQIFGNDGFAFLTQGVSLQAMQATSTTTDATVTAAQTIQIPNNSSALIEFRVIAITSSVGFYGNSAGFVRTVKVKNISNVLTLSSVQSDYTASDDPSWTATVSTGVASVSLNVTGAAGNTITWNVTAWIKSISF